MPYRPISKDLKQRALFLSDYPEVVHGVEEVLGVSRASIYRWRANFEKYGSVEPPQSENVGRPSILDSDAQDQLRVHLHNSPERYLDEIREWINVELDTEISRTIVHANIQECGFTHKKLRLRAIQRNEEDILAWKQETAEMYTAEQLISIDESSKDGRTLYRKHGWGLKGETPVRTVDFPRGERWSLLPALTIDGYIAARVIEGSVDAEAFLEFILEDVLPQMNRFPLPQSVILMDNCALFLVKSNNTYQFFGPPNRSLGHRNLYTLYRVCL